MSEQVLAIPATPFHESLGEWLGLKAPFGASDLERLLVAAPPCYLPRAEAELDPSFKQLVPYAVLRAGNAVFTYRRGKAGSESRLHDLWSIGIGGHVNPEDGPPAAAACLAALEREIAEETHLAPGWNATLAGLIYDGRT
ncbi:MAG TPA: phosphoesterase, partial [Planctomycetia bacterium]|nr:phosphoesterase [Planctomycetia bacterium]